MSANATNLTCGFANLLLYDRHFQMVRMAHLVDIYLCMFQSDLLCKSFKRIWKHPPGRILFRCAGECIVLGAPMACSDDRHSSEVGIFVLFKLPFRVTLMNTGLGILGTVIMHNVQIGLHIDALAKLYSG